VDRALRDALSAFVLALFVLVFSYLAISLGLPMVARTTVTVTQVTTNDTGNLTTVYSTIDFLGNYTGTASTLTTFLNIISMLIILLPIIGIAAYLLRKTRWFR